MDTGTVREIHRKFKFLDVQRKNDRTNTQQGMKGSRCFFSFLHGRRCQLDVLRGGLELIYFRTNWNRGWWWFIILLFR